MLTIKKKGNRYYREDRFNFRSFPIKKAEAEKLIAEGKAELVDKFIFEYSYEDITEVKKEDNRKENSNVFSITDRIKAKEEQKQTEEAIIKFKSDYLPNLTQEDILKLMNTSKEKFGEEVVKICWRIDLEKKQHNRR